QDGVKLDTGAANSILSNAIFANGGGRQVELVNNANNQQPAPVLTAATSAGGSTTITGTLQAAPATSYRIQFFSSSTANASGAGQGQTLLNAMGSPVTTDSSGLAVIAVTLPITVAADQFVSATVTNRATGDTSEFSRPQAVLPDVSISDVTVIAGSGN